MLTELRNSGYGCRLGQHWFGGLAYADDVILLSPSLHGLQKMVDICQSHAQNHDLLFSSDPDPNKSKTVCIAFNCQNKNNLGDIILNGDKLPWKVYSKHIGNYIHEDGTMNKDVSIKRAAFIQSCMSQNIEFECLSIESQIKLLNIYNSHFTGSNLWNFNSESVQKLISSWNVNIRIVSKLPIETHKYIVEKISDCSHIKHKLYSRYIKFLKSVNDSSKPGLKFLLNIAKNDIR